MARYRILYLTPHDSVLRAKEVEFSDDDAVIDHTGDDNHPHGIELWQDDRLVARFPSRRLGHVVAGLSNARAGELQAQTPEP